MSKLLLASAAASIFLLASCADQPISSKPSATYASAASNPFIEANYKAADELIALALARSALVSDQPMIMATVVDINVLDKSSAFGRTVSEQISARFTRRGFNMIEMKFRNSVYIKRSQGELSLTREIADLAQTYKAQAVIVGSYSDSRDYVYVNLKIIRPADNFVLAAYDYALPREENNQYLLSH